MLPAHLHRLRSTIRFLIFGAGFVLLCGNRLHATDYFLTIGGGYNPSGNQASLEANVLFFQQILVEHHRRSRSHDIYFADGHDPGADLQVLANKTDTKNRPAKDKPATEVLAALHRRRNEEHVEYRNHRVPEIAGMLDPALVQARLEAIAKTAHQGDRLIVYVTAHGSEGSKIDQFNTTIDCWNGKKITAREFAKWLNALPTSVPVVMVMAQCYCGGFGHTIFEDLDETKGLAAQVRAGFFAQQHDLPAAGCRPDISNDEEFSSYFWGAMAGRSRVGAPVTGCDVDKNGIISFAEAYAHAVTASPTIDIPLTTSNVLLKTYSRLTPKTLEDISTEPEQKPMTDNVTESVPKTTETKPTANDPSYPELSKVSGSLQSFVDRGRPVPAWIVAELTKDLGFTLHDDVASVLSAHENLRKSDRGPARGPRRRGGRRELLQEIAEKWPELGDEKRWAESALLRDENQEQLLSELKELPSWKSYEQRRAQTEKAGEQAVRQELREIKFRRLINALESIVLEKNLPFVATPEIVERYRGIIALEDSSLAIP